MPPTATADADTDITVTTATRSEEDVRASLEAVPPPATGATPPASAKPAAAAGATTPELEADSDRADTDVSEAARTLRSNRTSERVARLRDDVELYKQNVELAGGLVPAFQPREYKKATDEIDHLSRYRHELMLAMNKALREGRRPAAAAPTRPASAGADGKPAAPAAPAATPFTFQSFDDWQQAHPEADYADYLDARTDARAAFQRSEQERVARAEQETVRQRANEDAVIRDQAAYNDAMEKARAKHADFDAVIKQAAIPKDAHPQLLDNLQRLLLGEHGPAIMYYLGTNPEDCQRLFTAPSLGAALITYGEIKYAALRASGLSPSAAAAETKATAASDAAAVAAPAPPKPVSSAPAPLSDIKAAATDTRTIQQLAEQDQDADAYIEVRKSQQRGGRG